MYYYQTSILRSSAPVLTYSSTKSLAIGSIISIPLKTTSKEAVVTCEVDKPEFDTVDILSVSQLYYNDTQMSIARFISQYYFSSFGEAISLFLPFGHDMPRDRKLDRDIDSKNMPQLSQIQQVAYDKILTKDVSLLFGVTGSGKTEIFISLMAQMLKEGKSTIFLMPEISLTPQMEKRLKVYFGDTVAMWHSKLTKRRKELILEGISDGSVRIVAGARSALFVPLDNVGLIVIDEEHDDSYKSMTRPRYHARDIAVLMGAKLEAKVLLASATPSVGSYHRYSVIKLSKPFVETKKRYRFVGGSTLSSELVGALRANHNQQHQALLFLPTRGNFKYLYCESCAKTHLCPYCSVGMALHRYHRHLKCHYCGYTESIKDTCGYCGYHPLKSERMGTVEAIEMIAEQIPQMRVEQFDRDSITTAKRLKDALSRFESGQSDLLLGTQMLSKGHDYANITLSIIMGLDYIFGLADYRAKEKALSLLFQIAGRSGRAKSAEVLIQTNNPQEFEPYLGDYEKFLLEEIEFRRGFYPPFVSLARVLISHKDDTKANTITEDTITKLKQSNDIEIVGYGKAPIEKIANKYRYHILLRATKRVPLLKALHSVDCREIEIDMDAVEFG